MPRSISSNLQVEFNKSVTSIGYFVQWNLGSIIRWSSLGDLTWNGVPWNDYDFTIEGLQFDSETDISAIIKAQNLDSVLAGLLLNTITADAVIDIYQVARNALGVIDVPKLAKLAIDNCEITVDTVTVKLVSTTSMYAFIPRRRIDPANGFHYALPVGTQIVWGNEIFIVEAEDNG